MTDNTSLIKILFYAAIASGVVMRILAMYFFVSAKNKTITLTPLEVLSTVSRDDKSIYRMKLVYKNKKSPVYGYSENLNIQTDEMTLGCPEGEKSLYGACAVIQKYFIYKSAVIKRAHYNFSMIMSFFVGLFSVVSVFIASLGNNISDITMMTNGMLIYLVTFLCSAITSDFDVIAAIEAMKFIEKNRGIFSVNHYYARRIFIGYILHKLSRASAMLLFPAAVYIGIFM